ncbi:MAG TPA: hypothetical protein VFB63_30950 [Bryobacteraceae bacterium]|nr:hypothetical protein [Bryobacteraceae bacterium]
MKISLVLGISLLCSVAWAGDPVLGTWRLNLKKSIFSPGPAPKSQTRIYEEHGGGVRVTIKTVDAEGQTTSVQHPLNYDGRAYAVVGSSQTDAIILEKIDDYTSEAILKHATTVIGKNRRVVSRDGKTLTITYEGTSNLSQPVKNVVVYDRQ